MKDLSLDNYLKDQLKDPQFKREWEKSEIQYQVVRELIKSRLKNKVSQRNLAKKAKTTQAVISRIENMTISPTIGFLQRLAYALDKKLEIKFV